MGNNFFERFCDELHQAYPEVPRQLQGAEKLPPRQLISPYPVVLPNSVYLDAERIINAFFRLRNHLGYRAFVGQLDEIAKFDPGNFSVLMSYDFHFDPDNYKLHLIEINTNAGQSLIVDLIAKTHQNPSLNAVSNILHSFIKEFELYSNEKPDGATLRTIAIIDEDVRHQKAYCEFLMFKKIFEDAGYLCIVDNFENFRFDSALKRFLHHSGTEIDLVYNRYCDFLLERPESQHLRQAYLTKSVCFTPNPHEYLLMADKIKMTYWSTPDWWQKIDLANPAAYEIIGCVPRTYKLDPLQLSHFRNTKRGFFFKAARAHGGKSAYRGGGITHKKLEELARSGLAVAQSLVKPAELELEAGLFKCDLRFFVYQNQIQLVGARLYKGQVTNFSFAGGGWASVTFKP